MQDIKMALDPKNIFAINNTIYRLENEEEEDLNNHVPILLNKAFLANNKSQ